MALLVWRTGYLMQDAAVTSESLALLSYPVRRSRLASPSAWVWAWMPLNSYGHWAEMRPGVGHGGSCGHWAEMRPGVGHGESSRHWAEMRSGVGELLQVHRCSAAPIACRHACSSVHPPAD